MTQEEFRGSLRWMIWILLLIGTIGIICYADKIDWDATLQHWGFILK